MKKLMMTAAAVALAGAATASNVFDYKASVKYVDFKKVSGTYVKTVKSTSLKGYLVTPAECKCGALCAGRDPGFLVLTSSLAKKYDKNFQVKLMPANLLVDTWSQKNLSNKTSGTLEAQGYLFAGIGKNATFLIADTENGLSPVYGFGDLDVTEATRFLFGQANQSLISGEGEDMVAQFIEPFLDAAGFGKATYSAYSNDPDICGKGASSGCAVCLKNLSGSVIGGSYSCLPNGIAFPCIVGATEAWRCQGWNNARNNIPDFEYSGRDFEYNVVSGTWSIKENTKITAGILGVAERAALSGAYGTGTLATAALVQACGEQLQKTFSLATFDRDGAFPGKFVERWFVDSEYEPEPDDE